MPPAATVSPREQPPFTMSPGSPGYTKDEPGRLGFAHLNVTKDWDITLWWVLPQGLRWLLSSHCGLRVMVRSPNPAPPGLEKKQKPGRWDFSGPIPTLSLCVFSSCRTKGPAASQKPLRASESPSNQPLNTAVKPRLVKTGCKTL